MRPQHIFIERPEILLQGGPRGGEALFRSGGICWKRLQRPERRCRFVRRLAAWRGIHITARHNAGRQIILAQFEAVIDLATVFFLAGGCAARQHEKILWHADGVKSLRRTRRIRSQHAIGRLRQGNPSSRTDVKIGRRERDARTLLGRRCEGVVNVQRALFLARPRRIAAQAQRVWVLLLIFDGKFFGRHFMAVPFDAQAGPSVKSSRSEERRQ